MSCRITTLDYDELLSQSETAGIETVLSQFPSGGLQSTQVGRARALVQRVLYKRQHGEKVFLSYTSNLISCGLRDMFTHLAKHKLIDGVISSAGGIEEDVIKCLGPTFLGTYDLDGRALRAKGINRIGNLLVPNDNYCHFEDFFTPVLARLHECQVKSKWSAYTTPSELIAEMGKSLEGYASCEDSLMYWCYRNQIPVFCPALTDGSMGDMIYFYNFSKKGLVIDPAKDVVTLRLLRGEVNSAIVLGAGLPKHHLLTHIPVDNVVMVTTGIEADGCTSSCTLGDDAACGLLRPQTNCVRVQGDATVIFPLLVSKQ